MSAQPLPSPSPAPTPGPARLAPPARRRPRPWAWLALILVLGTAAVASARYLSRTNAAGPVVAVPTAVVTRGPLAATTRLNGQTSARNYRNITAPALRGPESNRPLVLLELADSGTLVKKGQVIARIDAQSLADHVDDVHDTVLQAENDIRKRRAEQALEWESTLR